ncbi:MAG: M48 family metallopeptidase [Gammaproteobacteria bacterium]|nr:M48 family metallopeptidase [Gammaproteobacteria bacterium]
MFNFLFRLKRNQLINQKRFKAPKFIELTGINRRFEVTYTQAELNNIKYKLQDSQLILTGNIDNHTQIESVLLKFLKTHAKETFYPICEQAAKEVGVKFNRITIRGQKTRWGSCSSKGNINLNYKLLFVEPEQVRYVIYHEMVHLQHFNHSRDFWQTLSFYVPNAKKTAHDMRRIRIDRLY